MRNHSAGLRGRPIYTLAQNGTESGESAITLTGVGSDMNDGKGLKGRARRKLITQTAALSLVDIAKAKNDAEGLKGFWNTFHCQGRVHTTNGRLYGKYCKNRFCTLCCNIRKADIINRYLPVIKKWEEPHFVTLTVKSIPYYSLNKVMRQMILVLNRIIAKYKKRNARGKGIRLIGIRSLESNFNPITKEYNPHFHIIVANEEMGNILIQEWVKRARPKKVNRAGQKINRVFNNVTALIEVVKYGSKIFTDPEMKKKKKGTGNEKIYAGALYTIFNAMKGLRIFERFGFNLPKEKPKKPAPVSIVKDYQVWEYDMQRYDWFNAAGERLTSFDPVSQLLQLLSERIDVDLE